MNSHRIRAKSCSKVDLSPIQNVFIVPWKCIYLEKSHYLPNVSFWPIRVTIILLRVGLAWETSALFWSVEKNVMWLWPIERSEFSQMSSKNVRFSEQGDDGPHQTPKRKFFSLRERLSLRFSKRKKESG